MPILPPRCTVLLVDSNILVIKVLVVPLPLVPVTPIMFLVGQTCINSLVVVVPFFKISPPPAFASALGCTMGLLTIKSKDFRFFK